MRLVQMENGNTRRVAIVEEPHLRLLRDFDKRVCAGTRSNREWR